MKQAYRLVGLLLALICLLTACLNIAAPWLKDNSMNRSWFDAALVIYASGLLLLVLIPVNRIPIHLISASFIIPVKRICSLYQFLGLVAIAVLLIIYRQHYPYVMTIILITSLMAIKYHILNYVGVAVLACCYLLLLVAANYRSGINMLDVKLFINTILFYLMLILLIQDELKAQFDLMKKYRQQAVRIREKLERYESQQLNPGTFGLTQREMEVLEILCVTNATNQDLADELGIKIHTVKTHLSNIFDKAGVDDRHQLIDLCRNYFIDLS